MLPRDAGPVGGTPALLVVDPQRDFLDPDGAAPCTATAESVAGPAAVVDNVNALIAAARAADVPIVYSKESHRPDHADAGAEGCGPTPPSHTVESTPGEAFVDKLAVDADALPAAEYLVRKRRYDVFFGTDLRHLLETYGVDTLLIAGVTTGVCVHYTAHGAHQRDYLFRVVRECTAGVTPARFEAGLTLCESLLSNGVVGLDAVERGLDDYGGNPVVARVTETGSVLD